MVKPAAVPQYSTRRELESARHATPFTISRTTERKSHAVPRIRPEHSRGRLGFIRAGLISGRTEKDTNRSAGNSGDEVGRPRPPVSGTERRVRSASCDHCWVRHGPLADGVFAASRIRTGYRDPRESPAPVTIIGDRPAPRRPPREPGRVTRRASRAADQRYREAMSRPMISFMISVVPP